MCFEDLETLRKQEGGTKRRIANLKAKGEMLMHEGKQPISEEGYRFLAEKALSPSTTDFSLYSFCHNHTAAWDCDSTPHETRLKVCTLTCTRGYKGNASAECGVAGGM